MSGVDSICHSRAFWGYCMSICLETFVAVPVYVLFVVAQSTSFRSRHVSLFTKTSSTRSGAGICPTKVRSIQVLPVDLLMETLVVSPTPRYNSETITMTACMCVPLSSLCVHSSPSSILPCSFNPLRRALSYSHKESLVASLPVTDSLR